jgi:SAM-dependent methyltransferase
MSERVEVWTYWEGGTPDYIALCLDSLQRHFGVRKLDRDGFDRLWLHDRGVDIDRLYVAHRADFIRAYLLCHFGGVWVDADCVALAPIEGLLPLVDRFELTAYREPTGGITNNFLMARPRAAAVRAFYAAVLDRLLVGGDLGWLEIGSVPLTTVFARYPEKTHLLPTEWIMPVSWSNPDRFVSVVEPVILAPPPPFCYMLSNHSLPVWLRSASRSELMCSPALLGQLYRRALKGDDAMSSDTPNYRYWQESGREWAAEYERRKTRHPFYHVAELMIADHVGHHAPCRVLEFGCGVGRHLRNLAQNEGVQAFGFDQSAEMMLGGFEWAEESWRLEHLATGAPTGLLPYADKEFDIVFTSEVLLHVRPEDLAGRLAELVRITRGHLLHLEPPPTWRGYSPWHNGCWGHDLVDAYRALGLRCEVLPAGFTRQVPYRVKIGRKSVRWQWSPVMLDLYRRMEESLENGFLRAGAEAYA